MTHLALMQILSMSRQNSLHIAVAISTIVDLSLMSPRGKHLVSSLANLQFTQMLLAHQRFVACSMMNGDEDQQEEESIGSDLTIIFEIKNSKVNKILS